MEQKLLLHCTYKSEVVNVCIVMSKSQTYLYLPVGIEKSVQKKTFGNFQMK